MARSKTHRVTLPESLDAWMRARMTAEGFTSVDEYMRHLVRTDANRERDALDARLLQSASSRIVPLTARKRSDIRARFLQRQAARSRKRSA